MNKCISISIEGSDGAGKQTTAKLLIKYLRETLSKKVATLSFPRYSETTGGKIMREVLKSERKEDYNFIALPPLIASLPYIMDRAESQGEILEMMANNDFLIFDRYVASNFIHQGGKIDNDRKRIDLISTLSDIEFDIFNLPKPDITIFLYLPTEVAMKNKLKQREKDENVKMDAGEDDFDYLNNSNKSGLWCAKNYGWVKINCIAEEDGLQKSPERILKEILTSLKL